MDFPNSVENFVANEEHRHIANEWWTELSNSSDPEEVKLQENISNNDLSERNSDFQLDLTNFCEGLSQRNPSGSETPIKSATDVINDTSAMVCLGPQSGLLEGNLFRVVSVLGAFRHLQKKTNRSKLMTQNGLYDPDKSRLWARGLGNEAAWRDQLNENAEIRGHLPNAFWTTDIDLKSKGVKLTIDRLFRLLGLANDPQTLHLFILLPCANVSDTFVPTGWDAFSHEYFQPQPWRPDYGWTLDLETQENGVREVVTKPIPVSKTKPGGLLEDGFETAL